MQIVLDDVLQNIINLAFEIISKLCSDKFPENG